MKNNLHTEDFNRDTELFDRDYLRSLNELVMTPLDNDAEFDYNALADDMIDLAYTALDAAYCKVLKETDREEWDSRFKDKMKNALEMLSDLMKNS